MLLGSSEELSVMHGNPAARSMAPGRLFLSPVVALLFSFAAHAEGALPMQWTAGHEQLLGAGDAAGGRELSGKCDRCHGENGVSNDGEVPHLAGQNVKYLYKQLQDFKSEARIDSGMNKRARKLSDKDMADLSAWYSSLELPAMQGVQEPAVPKLVVDGDPSRGIPACQDCHGRDGRGMSRDYDAPALAGMPYDYFVLTMEAFQDGSRANDLGGIVRRFAGQISEDEVKRLAEYYLALGRRERAPLQ